MLPRWPFFKASSRLQKKQKNVKKKTSKAAFSLDAEKLCTYPSYSKIQFDLLKETFGGAKHV